VALAFRGDRGLEMAMGNLCAARSVATCVNFRLLSLSGQKTKLCQLQLSAKNKKRKGETNSSEGAEWVLPTDKTLSISRSRAPPDSRPKTP